MAGIGTCCSALSSERNFLASRLEVGIQHRQRKAILRQSSRIRAEVNFVNAEEAKRLIAEGYAVLDVRDKTQYNRAHIKNFLASRLEVGIQHRQRKAILRQSSRIRAEVNFVNAEETKRLIAEGYAVLDVRDKTQYNRAHIKYNCETNRPQQLLRPVLRLAIYETQSGVHTICKKQFSPESKVLVVCQEGLRSTAAANKLEQAGFQDIVCITSGTFDSVGSTELQDVGKAGLVTVQGKISAVLGTILICALLFVTFFPDQAEKLL